MLSPIDGQPGSFTAKKLASVLVRLVDEQGAPLPGVLVSLSGGENNYRTNEQTGPNGSLSFLGLSPGEYFVKPVLKEYEFEPRSKLITVKEGAEELVEVTAKRIAFSLYGSVTGLKGEPEAGGTMEAIGQGEGTKYQEEATTGQVTSKNLQIFIQLSFHVIIQDGKLRIRGLQPSCSYQLGLKSTRSNIHVERTIPATRLKTLRSVIGT